MPGFDAHIVQADSNIAFVKEIQKSGKFPDWLVTGCFYTAVHLIEADIFTKKTVYYKDSHVPVKPLSGINHSEDVRKHFPKESLVPHSPHYLRKVIINTKGNNYSPDVADAYANLEEHSHVSRYGCYSNCEEFVEESIEGLNLIIEDFNRKHPDTALPKV